MRVSYVVRFDDDYRLIAERLSAEGAEVLHAISSEDSGCFHDDLLRCHRDMAACRRACEDDAGMMLPWEHGGKESLELFLFAGPVEITSVTRDTP